MNEAFKIIFIKSTANQKKKNTKTQKNPQYACRQDCLESDACVGPCIVVTTPRPHLKSEGHRTTVEILGGSRTFGGSPDFLGLLTNK